MSKRYGKNRDSDSASFSKRAKLDVTITSSQQGSRVNRPPSTSKNDTDNDLWGADFDDADIEEMDIIASQASSENLQNRDPNEIIATKIPLQSPKPSTSSYFESRPSTSRSNIVTGNSQPKKFEPKIPSKISLQQKDFNVTNHWYSNQARTNTSSSNNQRLQQSSQKISSSENQREVFKHDKSILFDDFQDNLLKVHNHNSTFQSQITKKDLLANNGSRVTNNPGDSAAINISDDSILRQIEKLKLENKKLLDNYITKEGETAFLRNQLQQTQSRSEHDKIDKARQIEEQANQYRSEINVAIKREETLRTQLEFQNLQLNNLKERCTLLESGSVKLKQPHTAQLDPNINRNRLNTTLSRTSSSVKTVRVTDSGVQTTNFDLRNAHRLKKTVETYPLSIIPQSIFAPSRAERPVVEIQLIEKVGTKNLPILQEEENIRIFENPDLVKPIVTTVNEQKLNIEFCLPDVAALMRKTEIEINAQNMLPTINKLVAVARELLLNTTLVLQRISKAMRNDDVRDMNDVYFSDFYKLHVDSSKSICDSNAWHDRERGIEAMRSIAILSYTAPASIYLRQYVTGKIPLNVYNDSNYDNYIKQMTSYKNWLKKGCKFEMLELLLEFVTTVGYVRRSHQFSGLIVAITRLLVSVKETIVHSKKGIEYVFNIFKEIVFARPLLICYTHVTELLMIFCQCAQFSEKLCIGKKKMAISVWKDDLHFTSDACVMQIYIGQLEFFQPDSIAIVNIAHSLVCCVLNILSINNIPWVTQPGHGCKCSMKLFGLTLNFLYKCSKVNFDEPVQKQNSEHATGLKESRNGFYLSYDTTQVVSQNPVRYSGTMCANLEHIDYNTKVQSKHKQLLTIRKGIMFLCYLSTRDPDFIIRLTDIEDSFNLFIHQIDSYDNLELNETEKAALSSVKSTFVFDKTTTFEGRHSKSQSSSIFKNHFELKERVNGPSRQQIVKLCDNRTLGSQKLPNERSWLSGFISKKKRREASVPDYRQHGK